MFFMNRPLTVRVADWPAQLIEKANNVGQFCEMYCPRELRENVSTTTQSKN